MHQYRFAALLVLFLTGSSLLYAQSAQLLDRVIAVVNEDAITESELDLYLRPIYEDMKKEYTGQQLMEEMREIRKKLLNQMIEDRLVYQEAKKIGLEIPESEIGEEIMLFKKRFPSPAEFEKALQEEGLTIKNLEEKLKKQVMVRRLHDIEVRSKILVSPSEAEKYYNEHTAEFEASDEALVRIMTVKKSNDARQKGLMDEAAKKKIEELRERILKGEDFAELASKNSEDYQAAKGGLTDWLKPGSMIPVIDDAIFSLPAGQISQVIETPMGYHFFRIEERKKSEKKSFDQVRDQIVEKLYQAKGKARFYEWMQELKRKAYISFR